MNELLKQLITNPGEEIVNGKHVYKYQDGQVLYHPVIDSRIRMWYVHNKLTSDLQLF